MAGFDPTWEIELSERSVAALDQEELSPLISLFRRVVEANRRARSRHLDLLLARIDVTLRSA